MFRRTFAIALLTAVFCCTLSVPRADEPPSDSLAKYLPAETFVYVEAPDLGATWTRAGELAITKFFSEGGLPQLICEKINASFGAEENRRIDFAAIPKLLGEMTPRFASAFTGRAEFAWPSAMGDVPSVMIAFRVADGKDAEAKAIVEDIVKKLVDDIIGGGILTTERVEYKGAVLLGVPEAQLLDYEYCPWFCVTNGFAIVTYSRSSMNMILEAFAAPPEDSLLARASFRKGYASVTAKDVRVFFSFGGLLCSSSVFRRDMGRSIGEENVTYFENADLTYGVTLNKMVAEDDLYVSLGDRQWPFPTDFFAADSFCKGVSASLFPSDTTAYACANLDFAKILKLMSAGDAKTDLNDLKAAGVDIEKDLIPLLGPEVSLGVIAKGSIPSGMIAVQLKDAAAGLAWFKNLAAVTKDAFADPVEYGGATLFPYRPEARAFLDLPSEMGRAAFAVKESWLLYGPMLTLKNALSSKAGALPKNPDFAAAVPTILTKQPQVLAFVNLRSIVRQYYPLLLTFFEREAPEGEEIAMALLAPDRVEELAFPMVIGGTVTPDGGKLFSTSPFGIAPLLPPVSGFDYADLFSHPRHPVSNESAAM
ncbi:MAG: hypothetical protein WC712_10910 [Candidatus Brocadiia bacterium]